MPIPLDRLNQTIHIVDETTTFRQVVSTLLSGEPYNQWYTVVVRRQTGGFSTFTLVELNDDAERLGRAVDVELADQRRTADLLGRCSRAVLSKSRPTSPSTVGR